MHVKSRTQKTIKLNKALKKSDKAPQLTDDQIKFIEGIKARKEIFYRIIEHPQWNLNIEEAIESTKKAEQYILKDPID